jgi:hypothetical protein
MTESLHEQYKALSDDMLFEVYWNRSINMRSYMITVLKDNFPDQLERLNNILTARNFPKAYIEPSNKEKNDGTPVGG